MKKFALVLVLLLAPANAFAYVIDGKITDWGINIAPAGDPWSSYGPGWFDSHLPSGGNNIDYVTEDNTYIYGGIAYVGPGWAQGNNWDAEALYMDNDDQYIYVAIVTGVAPDENIFRPGSIFIDTGDFQNPVSGAYDPLKYKYAVNVYDSKLYEVKTVDQSIYFHDADPWQVHDGTLLSQVDFAYTYIGNSHYAMEAKIPVNLIGVSPNQNSDIWVHWGMECGNDQLNLKGDFNAAAVPEPASMGLMAFGLVGAAARLRRKR